MANSPSTQIVDVHVRLDARPSGIFELDDRRAGAVDTVNIFKAPPTKKYDHIVQVIHRREVRTVYVHPRPARSAGLRLVCIWIPKRRVVYTSAAASATS